MRAGFRVSCWMLLVIVLGVLGLGCAQDSGFDDVSLGGSEEEDAPPSDGLAQDYGFADVSPDAFYSEAVEELAGDGVFDDTGCGDGRRFCPEGAVDRQTMAVWLVRVLDGGDPGAVSESRFDDIGVGGFHAPFVERLAELRVTVGCGDGRRFCPEESVTRAQMATLLVRAFKLADGPDPGFVDVGVDAWYRDDVSRLESSGISLGCGNGSRFCPADETTRGQMAVFIARAIGRVPLPARTLVTPRPVTRIPASVVEYASELSPDLSHVVYHNTFLNEGDGSLYVAGVDGTGLKHIMDNAGLFVRYWWSPDSERFLYRMDGGLFVVTSDGSDPVKLADNAYGEWSPNGRHIAYVSDGELFIAAADGSNPIEVADNWGGGFVWWAPDSKHIVYRAMDGGLFVVAVDGSNRIKVGNASPNVDWGTPWVWSPDGARIAFFQITDDRESPGWWETEISLVAVTIADGSRRIVHTTTIEEYWCTNLHMIWTTEGIYLDPRRAIDVDYRCRDLS